MFEEELEELLNNEKQAYSLLKYLDNEDFEKELIIFTKKGFSETAWKSFPSQESRNLVMLGLTFIALKYYDGALWPHVYNKFSDIYDDQKILESKIRDGVLSLLTSKYNCERKHYQIPVMNAIVPFKYASNYIEFANDIYVKNMDCNIDEFDIEEEIENVFDAISESLTDSDDSFKYNYEQNNSKTYKLIRATKNIIKSGFKKDELILFTRDIIKKLDYYYQGKDVYLNPYIDKSFNKWEKETQRDGWIGARAKSNFIKSKFPYFTFLNNNGNIYLHTPTKRLFGSYSPQGFSMEILENDKVLYRDENLIVEQLLGGSEIVQRNYKIDNPLNKIRCKIYYDQEVVYDSKDFLYRDFLLFDDNKEIKNNKEYRGLVYFIYKNVCDNRLNKVKENDSYKIASLTVYENQEYILDNKYIISFSDLIKSGIVGEKLLGLELFDEKDIVPIYKTIDRIYLTSQNTNRFANKIKINGVFVEVNDFIEITEQANAITYILNIEKMNLDSNFYFFELVDIQQDKAICKYKFLYDKSIEIQQTLISETMVSFQYNGSFLMTDMANRDYSNFNVAINDLGRKNKYLNIKDYLYKCKFSLTVPYYRIDDGCVYTFEHNLTSEDFNFQSKLYFNVPNCDKVLYVANNTIGQLTIKTVNSNTYIELSEMINFKKSKLIELSFISGNIERQFLKIYNDIFMNYKESYYSIDARSKEVEFKTVIDGIKETDDIFIELSNKDSFIGRKKIFSNSHFNKFYLGDQIQKIYFRVCRKLKEFIGFKTVETKETLWEGNFAYYPFGGLINKYLSVVGASLENDVNSERYYPLKNTKLKIIKDMGQYYIGYLYLSENFNIKALDNLGCLRILLHPVYTENKEYFCKADIYFYNEAYNEATGEKLIDNLRYNKFLNKVLNGRGFSSPPIKDFKINLTLGEKEYADFKSNRKS